MKRERKSHGMAIKLSSAGELRHFRGKLLLHSGGAALSPPRKFPPKNSKSKDKGKGSNKARSFDIRLNPHLVSWKIMGSSGKGVSCRDSEDEEEEETIEMREERESEEERVFGEERDGDDDVMDFYEVWGMWEYVDEEDWCVVGEDM